MSDGVPSSLNWAERAYHQGSNWTQRLTRQIRPRVSLASGSLLVLLTLFLPVGYEACGPHRSGYELIHGKGDWPTLMGFASSAAGRYFYGLVLLLALFTLALVLVSAVRPGVTRSTILVPRLAFLTGCVSLFLVCDVTLFLTALAGDRAGMAAWVPLAASCLAPVIFWSRRTFASWVGILVFTVSSLVLADRLGVSMSEPVNWIVLGAESVYSLLPLGIWYRYGFSLRPNVGSQWEVIRRGLAALYFAAALGNLWFLALAVKEGLWGFVPCYFGIQLLALGYWSLQQRLILFPVKSSARRA